MTKSLTIAPELKLKHGMFQALLTNQGVEQLDQQFLSYLQASHPDLRAQLLSYRNAEHHWSAKAVSEFIIACAPVLDAFIVELFDIASPALELTNKTLNQDPVFAFKKHYVQTHAKRNFNKLDKSITFSGCHDWLLAALHKYQLCNQNDLEMSVAQLGLLFLRDKDNFKTEMEQLVHWCVRVQQAPEGLQLIQGWQSFRLPQKVNIEHLVPTETLENDEFERFQGPSHTQRQRDGFKLTDARMSAREVLSEINYCVYCHKTEGDFCSKGFPVKKNKPELGLKKNAVGDTLTGCPLEEKISEMHVLKKAGVSIGALAVIMIDNPMCAATGHRICNDCMKACIYQKQDPVNIPQVETRTLTDVLELPWGVEIYDLLMRWNPLRRTQFLPKAYNGTKVLVMGMGPAGFTLSHHLLMEGCAVVGADGLKIEPIDSRLLSEPVHSFTDIQESLDDRVMTGFGGVAEYGITVRWDKNFLKLIYMSLARRALFQVFGNVRFGGTVTVESAWEMGFDHVAIAVGAGLPRELHIPNSLAPGMRQANDFLMALQLTGAVKKNSLANLQVRLPAVVIGGGLTGIDAATEIQAYYIQQVEKVHLRYMLLKNRLGEEKLRSQFSVQSLAILDEQLLHAEAIIAERDAAQTENRQPNLTRLIQQWGGVTVVYRKRMQDSPAYQRNHEEIIKALEEGILYAEKLSPIGVELDRFGDVSALHCHQYAQDDTGNWASTGQERNIPAKSILVATGAKPNVAYSFEHRGTFERKNMNYLRCEIKDNELVAVENDAHIKSENIGIFTSYTNKDNNKVSFIGDTHPIFNGSVVKAIASAKRSYPDIMQALKKKITSGDMQAYAQFKKSMSEFFTSYVTSIDRVATNWIQLTVHAPKAASCFAPGQFYRLQNFEVESKILGDTQLQTEGVSALGIKDVDHPEQLQFLIRETGASTRVLSLLQPGDPIALMGPSGVKTPIPSKPESTLIVGDSAAIPYVLSVGLDIAATNSKIDFICQLSPGEAPFCSDALEKVSRHVTWLSSHDDLSSQLACYQKSPLREFSNLIVVGKVSLLKEVQQIRHGILSQHLNPDIKCIASVYGPMQCMLKGVCAQCLQWQIDPATGKRTKAVYACSWHHQPIDIIDMHNLDERLSQNKMQEQLSNLWLDYLFAEHNIKKV